MKRSKRFLNFKQQHAGRSNGGGLRDWGLKELRQGGDIKEGSDGGLGQTQGAVEGRKKPRQNAGCSKAEDQMYAYRMGKKGGIRVLVRNDSLL